MLTFTECNLLGPDLVIQPVARPALNICYYSRAFTNSVACVPPFPQKLAMKIHRTVKLSLQSIYKYAIQF